MVKKNKDTENEEEEDKEDSEEIEEEEGDEEDIESSNEKVEKETKNVAQKISTYLKLDELNTKIDKILGRNDKSSLARKVFSEVDTKKEVEEMTKEEKIVGFFTALIRNDKVALKALSEGMYAAMLSLKSANSVELLVS